MNNERRPNVNVIYQDAPAASGMGCMELIVSVATLAVLGLVMGWYAWPW